MLFEITSTLVCWASMPVAPMLKERMMFSSRFPQWRRLAPRLSRYA
jgi:hypothetical protein